MRVTGKIEDIGKFKTPTLRNIARTAPYMHDGSLKTLDEVIDFYDSTEKFLSSPINKDSILKAPLQLTAQEKTDLKSFLLALTDRSFSNPH